MSEDSDRLVAPADRRVAVNHRIAAGRRIQQHAYLLSGDTRELGAIGQPRRRVAATESLGLREERQQRLHPLHRGS